MFTSRHTTTQSHGHALGLVPDITVDNAFERWLDWRRQSSLCEAAYRHWSTTASSRDGALAFAVYTAALDREEQAAAQYQAAVLQAGRLTAHEPNELLDKVGD